jgi:hypothetical protein
MAGTIAVLAGAITAVGFAVDAAPASAAAAPAFECSDPRFFAQAEEPVGTAQLFEGRYNAQGASAWSAIGGTKSGANLYNALAFNPTDEYLYGTIYGSTAPGSIVRIDRTGATTNLGVTSPALGNGYSTLWDSGEFDAAGNYYVASGNAGSASAANIRKISGLKDVTSSSSTPRPSLTTVTLTPTPRFADLAYKAGFLWAANYGQSATIYRIDVNGVAGTAGTVTSYNVAGILPVNSYGSAFTMTNGNLAFIGTNSHMYQVSVANPAGTPTFELVGDVAGPANQRSDATNCSTAPISSLSVVKTGPATVVVGEPIAWDITVTNDGPGTTSGFVINDLLPAGLSNVKATSTDSGCVVNSSTTTITCNGGRLLKDATAKVRVTATAPSTAGVIVNRVKVLGNEDPEPDPASSASTTVTYATTTNTQFTVPTPAGIGTNPAKSAKGGTLSLVAGKLVYTSPANYSGLDSFSYTTSGGDTVDVVITVRPVAGGDSTSTAIDTPVTVTAATMLANDHGVNTSVTAVGNSTHGSVALVDGAAVFTPASGYYGPASFEYTLTGDGGSATGIVSVEVNATAPSASDDSATAKSGVAKTITAASLLGNDTGTATLTIASVTQPSHGAVTRNSSGDIVYTSAGDYVGTDTFTYTASGPGGTDTATVTVTVSAVAPSAFDDAASADSGTPTTITAVELLGNDSGTSIELDSFTQPANGTVTKNSSGDPVYTSTGGYVGADSFAYTITGPGGSDTAIVAITVAAVAPTATDDSLDATADTGTTITSTTLLGNDTGTAIKLDTFTQPAHGAVTKNSSSGALVYTPTAGFIGADSFTYTITGPGGSDTATVNLNVKAAKADAKDDSAAAKSGVATEVVTKTLLGNDLGTAIALTAFGQPLHGKVTKNADGDLVYTSATGYVGADSFTYTITGANGSDTATVTIDVTAVASDAVDDSAYVQSGTATAILSADLLGNDYGTAIALDSFTQPAHGSVTKNIAGALVYTSTVDYVGADSFTYTITGPGGTDTATVSVVVKPIAPVAVADSASADSGMPTTVTPAALLTNDSGTAIKLTSYTQPGHGSVTKQTDGSLSYTSTAGYVGTDSFTYTITGPGGTDTATVSITVAAVTAHADNDSADAWSGTPKALKVGALLANDEGTGIALESFTQPSHGTVAKNTDGDLVYTSTDGYVGADSFAYTITGPGGSDTATVTIAVAAVVPVAADDSVDADSGAATTIDPADLLDNDLGTTIVFDGATKPEHGSVSIVDGKIVYTSDDAYVGKDTFTYTVTGPGGSDTATVTVTVSAVASKAVDDSTSAASGVAKTITRAELLSDDSGTAIEFDSCTQPGHGTVTEDEDGELLYTSTQGYVGEDSFEYTITGPGGTDTATVTITVSAVAPTAVDDTAATKSDTAVTITVDGLLADDSGTEISFTSFTQPGHGTVTTDEDGDLVYSPAAGYSGTDSFSYTITGTGGTDTAVVTITVTPVAPAASDDSIETPADTAKTVPLTTLLGNDSGTAIAVTSVGSASHGVVTRDEDGSVVYTPAKGFSGDDTFEYTISGPGGTDTATVAVIVRPVAAGGALTVPAGSQRDVRFDDLGDGLEVTAHSDPAHGTITVVDGVLVYTPKPGFSGKDSFTYTVTDEAGRTSTGTVTIVVTPVAANLDESTPAGSPVTVDPIGHSSGSDLAVVEIVKAPEHGTVSVNPDGTVTYTPADGYTGDDSFEYVIRDGDGGTATGTITITVTASAAAPAALASTGFPALPGALLALLLLAGGIALARRRTV